jgi:hypothetical protein
VNTSDYHKDIYGPQFQCRVCIGLDCCFMCKPYLELLHGSSHEWKRVKLRRVSFVQVIMHLLITAIDITNFQSSSGTELAIVYGQREQFME